MHRMKKVCLFFIFVLLLTACSPSTSNDAPETEPETAVFEPTQADIAATPTLTPTEVPPTTPSEPAEPTAVPTDEPVTEEVVEEPVVAEVEPETAVISGRTDEGAFFYGDPNAPITLIDYSDFL